MKQNIIVLGGGSAGWLTALFIKKNYPSTNITVIEDPATPPIIAGESGSGLMNKLYNFLGINFDEWVAEVNAMPKLGGTFTDWDGVGTDFVHGLISDWYDIKYRGEFSEFGRSNDFISCALARNIKLEDVFYNGKLQRLGKLPITNPTTPNTRFHVISMPMWHFDSRANADFLKRQGLKQGISLIEGKYLTCERLTTGGINSLTLENGTVIQGDWFFDCSGFARLLMHKELGEPLTDLTNFFPARQVVAWWDNEPKLLNYTDIRALKYGWSWNITLNHRSGNGYIFDPDLITIDQAVEEIETTIGKQIDPVAKLKFTPCQMQNSWKENVFAFGLSSGFVEPLESNGLLVVIAQLGLLSEYWFPNYDTADSTSTNLFNKEFISQMDEIRDFLALHYRGHRRDTEFWRSHAYDKFRIPEPLQHTLDLYSQGHVGINNKVSYGHESWATVAQGLNLVNLDKLRHNLLSKRRSMLDDFDRHYTVLAKDVDQISQICYTVEQWKNIIYGKS